MLSERFNPSFRKTVIKAAAISAVTIASFISADRPVEAQIADDNYEDKNRITFQEKVETVLLEGVTSIITSHVKDTIENVMKLNFPEDKNSPMLSAAEENLIAQQDIQILPPADRENCDEIRGDNYRSNNERTFFLENCIVQELIEQPQSQATTKVNRADCDTIHGADYYSPTEREWYLANCIVEQVAAQQQIPQGATDEYIPTTSDVAGFLSKLRACEATNNYQAVSPNGLYFGAYQFDLQTWASVGGTGNPAHASPAEQDYRATILYAQRGVRPWPHCGPLALR